MVSPSVWAGVPGVLVLWPFLQGCFGPKPPEPTALDQALCFARSPFHTGLGERQGCIPHGFFVLNCGIGSSVSCPQSYDLWKTSLKAENYYSDKPSGRSLIQLLRQPTDPGCSPRSPSRCLPRHPPLEPTPPCPSRSVLGLPFPGWINSGRSSFSRKTPAPTWSSQNQ